MENVNSLKINRSSNYNENKNRISNKQAALIGVGAGLAADTMFNSASIAYKVNQFVKQNKQNGIDINFKDGLKKVWNAFKENGNVEIKNGEIIKKIISVGGKTLNGKYVMALNALVSASLGAALGVTVNHFENKK